MPHNQMLGSSLNPRGLLGIYLRRAAAPGGGLLPAPLSGNA